jgi:hypothetical protein
MSALSGDVNGDGRVSGPDVLYLGSHMGEVANGESPASPADCADTNGNGFVDTGDIIEIGAHYREEEDGVEFYRSMSDTVLGPYQPVATIDRPEGDGSDPLWDACQPAYGTDTEPIVDMPDHFPYFYKAAAYYYDPDTGLTSYGPDSAFATGNNVLYMEVDEETHEYGNGDDIIVSFNLGAMESTDNLTVHVTFDPLAVDLDIESWVPGDFFGPNQSHTIFYTEGTGFFDLAINDLGNPNSGDGWLGDLTFTIEQDDYQTNFLIGIDPLQGSFYEDASGSQVQFVSVGDTWAKWGEGTRPPLGVPQCYRFFDMISSTDGTGNWNFWSAPDDQNEETMWHFTNWTFCSGPSSMWFGQPGSDPPTYGDRAHDYADTVPIDLTDFTDPEGPIPSLTFKYWHNFEQVLPPVDYGRLLISSAPYETWDEIQVFSGDSVPDGPGDPEDPNPCPDWTSFAYSLENYIGDFIKIRFEGVSDFSNPQPFQGMAVDSVAVGFEAGTGGSGAKKVRLLAVQDYSNDSYNSWNPIVSSFEELGIEEADEAADDSYVVFNNYSSSYTTYFVDEELLEDFNAIYWFNGTYYYGTLWGSDDERELIKDWIEGEEGRLFVWNGYHYSPRYFGYSSSYDQYDPEWMEDTFGLQISNGYRYCRDYAPSTIEAEVGEMYEDLDGESFGSYYNGTYAYAYDWVYNEDTTVPLGHMADWVYIYNYYYPSWDGPANFAWHKDDTGSHAIYDEAMPNMLDTDVVNLRTQLWFEETGFTLPAESWTEGGDCIIDDVLPSPDNGPGFSWGGAIYEGGGGGTDKPIRLLAVQDYYSDSYGNWPVIISSFENLGLEEDDEAADGAYVVFNNYSSTYQTYYIDEDLMGDFNAIYWFNSTYYYGTLWGSDTERELIKDWIEGEEGRLFVWNGYHYSPRYFGYSPSYDQYDPEWMEDTFGLQISNGYRYQRQYPGPGDIVAYSGEMYEDLDGEDLYSYYYGQQNYYVYAYDWLYNEDTTTALAYLGTYNYTYQYPSGSWSGPAHFAWYKDDNGSHAIYDETMPNALPEEAGYLRTQLWFEKTGFTLP